MNLRRVYTIFLRQLFLYKRSKYRVFGLFYWSILDLLLWGMLTIYLQNVGGKSLGFIGILLGAIILWNFLLRVQHGITIPYLEDVWVRNFMNLFASPLSINEYLLGLVLTSFITTAISMFFMVLLAWFLFAYSIFQFGMLLLPFVAVLFVFGIALGILTTAIILRLGPSSEILAWSIPAIISPLAGVLYPVSSLPKFLQPVANFLPPTHVFEGMRAVALYGMFDSNRLIIAFLLSTAFFVLSYVFMLMTYRFVLRTGHFTKFFSD